MPLTAPSNPAETDEEDDLTPLPPPVRPTGLDDDEPETQVAPAPIVRTAPPQVSGLDASRAGGRMDAPDLQTRMGVNALRMGQAPTDKQITRIADRQRLEQTPALSAGGEGPDAPDLALRRIALKSRAGMPLSQEEQRRLAVRQGIEAQAGAPKGSISTMLEGTRLDPRGTYKEQDMAARRTAVEAQRAKKTAEKDALKAENAAKEAEMRGTGQKFYTDPYGKLQPVIEAGTNRPLYHATLWEDGGVHPQTKEPTLVKRDQYGQRQYKTPPIVASPDLEDNQLYYKFGDDDLRPAGEIEALKNHQNPNIARLAKRVDRQRRQSAWKEALGPMEAAKADADSAYDMAQQDNLSLGAQIEQLTQQQAVAPSPQLDQQIQALAMQQADLSEKLKPTGALGRMKRTAALDYSIFKAKATHSNYADLAEERREILRAQGKSEADDPTLKSILSAQETYGNALKRATSVAAQEAVARQAEERNRLMVPAPTGTPPATGNAPITALRQAGATALGSIAKGLEIAASEMPPTDEFGRYYNAEAGAEYERQRALPAAERMKEIQQRPLFQFGQAFQEAAKEAFPLTPEQETHLGTKLGALMGGFVPLAASGPLAPGAIALQTTGDEMERIYADRVAKGATPDRAADFAINRALASGAVQGVLFEALPAPLQKLGNKAIDAIAKSAMGKWLAGRVAQGVEGAAMGAGSTASSNVVAGRPVEEGTGESAAGLGAMQALMPRGGARPAERPPEAGRAAEAPPVEPAPTAPASPDATVAKNAPVAPDPAKLDRIAELAQTVAHGSEAERAAANAELEKMVAEAAPKPANEAPAPTETAKPAPAPESPAPVAAGEPAVVARAEAAPEQARPVVAEVAPTPSLQDSSAAERGTHNAEVAGSTPAPATKPMPPTWRITVQEKQGDVPGYTQIDRIGPDGKNAGSVSPEKLRAEGYDVPDLSTVKQGQYTAEQLSQPTQSNVPEIKVQESPAPVSEARVGGEPVVREGRNDERNAGGRGEQDAGAQGAEIVRAEVAKPLTRPKDAAPISAAATESTPETVTGPKINKEWTAFGPESGTLGIPRAEMPQIKSEHRGALVNFLRARGIEARSAMVDPSQLKPTQAEFSPGKVQSAREFRGSERPILISSDGHVVDGHHQWLAALDDATPMSVIKLNKPIDKVLAEMKEFPSAENAKGATTAPKATAAEPSVSAAPAKKRLSDRAIDTLEKIKIDTKNVRYEATGAVAAMAYNKAIELAILGVRAGRAVTDVVKLAVARYKAQHPKHTPEEVAKLETDIRSAIENRPPEPEPGKEKSRVPQSLRDVGVPAKDIEYDVRAQNERMAEARAHISKNGEAAAEAAISDRSLPPDTRVALGGVLLEKKMEALRDATPEQAQAITRDIQRITEATRSGVSTESGQGVAMHQKIYQNLAVGSAMEYVKARSDERVRQLGGKEALDAADAAAKELNKAKTEAEKVAAIEKLREKYTTKPARKVLDNIKGIEKIRELNRLGVLTRDDLVNVAGNALGLPGIERGKLKQIADLVNKIDTAKNHAERSRAELELHDTLQLYKGVKPLDLETSILTLNILSGATTQAANIEGNALNLLSQLATTAAVNPGRLGSIMEGVKQGIPIGWDQAKSIMQTGRGSRDFQDRTLGSSSLLSTVDYAREFPKLPKLAADLLTKRARIVDKIGRFMKAADAVFYYPAREAYARLVATKLIEGEYKGPELARRVSEALHTTPEAFESAKQQAIRDGYTGVDLGRRVADIIEERRTKTTTGTEAVKQSERFAAEATYNNEPVGLAGVIYRNLSRTVKDADVGGVPVLKPWAMFLRIPANVFNTTTNYTPLGALRAHFGVKGEKYQRGRDATAEGQWRNYTADERNRMYLQSVVGTTLMGALTAASLGGGNGSVTASGPNDPEKRRQLQQAGWNPYSIKVGDKWVSYKDSPLLVPLAIVGHVADSLKYQKAKSDMVLENRVADSVAHAPQIIFQTSMLSGLSDLMGALSGKGDVASSVGRTLGSIPANLAIPYNRLLQQVDQTMDTQTYKNNPVVGGVPFARRTGEPQTDVQGRPREYSPTTRFVTTEKNDPVDNVLREKNVFIPGVSKDTKVANRTMTDPERDAYERLSGMRIRNRLKAIAPLLKNMTQEKAQAEVSRIAEEERSKVKPLIRAGVGVKK